MTWARTESDAELAYLRLIADKAIEWQGKQRIDLAQRITENLATLFGAKKKA